MTRSHFLAVAERAAAMARDHPAAYQRRVWALLLLGRAFLLGFVLVLLGSLLGCAIAAAHVWVGGSLEWPNLLLLLLLGAIFLVLLCVTISSWSLRSEEPVGIILTERDAPGLFAELETVRNRLRVPRIHRVFLLPAFHVNVSCVAGGGLFTTTHRNLHIGLPLLQALTLEQFRGVLAHELAHFSGRLNSFQSCVYRTALKWTQLEERMRSRAVPFGSWLLVPFLRWYAPMLWAWTAPLRRLCEMEADALAVRTTNAADFASCLVTHTVRSRYNQRVFWPMVFRGAAERPQPPDRIFDHLRASFQQALSPSTSSQWLALALAQETGLDSDHPCLRDRLAAIGGTATLAPPPSHSAAQALLGAGEEGFITVLSGLWRTVFAASWRMEFQRAAERRGRLDALEAEYRARGVLTAEAMWEYAQLVEEFCSAREAFPHYRTYLEGHRSEPRANLAFGRILLEEDDARGVAFVERALRSDPLLLEEATEALLGFYARAGNEEGLRHAAELAAREQARLHEASLERACLDEGDTFEPHDLEPWQVDLLAAGLARGRWGSEVYLVRKRLAHFEEQHPLYVLAILPARCGKGAAVEELVQECRHQVLLSRLQCEFLVVPLLGPNSAFRRTLKIVPGARIV